mmetsp:Transcript_154146/g.494093  ORF Transcript_154146/g.494093 Transcript_154146/m.494093 type:complete len:213 (-) Transcript_154146:13-651(-)
MVSDTPGIFQSTALKVSALRRLTRASRTPSSLQALPWRWSLSTRPRISASVKKRGALPMTEERSQAALSATYCSVPWRVTTSRSFWYTLTCLPSASSKREKQLLSSRNMSEMRVKIHRAAPASWQASRLAASASIWPSKAAFFVSAGARMSTPLSAAGMLLGACDLRISLRNSSAAECVCSPEAAPYLATRLSASAAIRLSLEINGRGFEPK